jgi:hypothetical protein
MTGTCRTLLLHVGGGNRNSRGNSFATKEKSATRGPGALRLVDYL